MIDLNTSATVIAAISTTVMAYFSWLTLTRNKPIVSVSVHDLPHADIRGHKDEALQKQGFCLLKVSIQPTTNDFRFSSLQIPNCKVASEVMDEVGSFARQSSDRMTRSAVAFPYTAYANQAGISFTLLIKPDAQEQATLNLILKGHLFSKIYVPFRYVKTHYIGE